VHARFLLGPAGAGKTFRCLSEIRQALLAEPDGPPLIFLAPKQATFQLERQLLADENLQGYTRLQILSFERLAKFVLARASQPEQPLLSEDGRAMVLHALLARRRKELQIFHASAGLPGFARQLSLELRELQQRQVSPEMLRQLAAQSGLSDSLRRKLHDLSVLLGDYLAWLQERSLQDAERLLDLAAAALQRNDSPAPLASALWLDGFAEMTPPELDLLAAAAARCQQATLAFCLEAPPAPTPGSWLSIWTGIGETFRQCHARFSALPGARVTVEVLPRDPTRGRFADNPALRHLEEKWTRPAAFPGDAGRSGLGGAGNPAIHARGRTFPRGGGAAAANGRLPRSFAARFCALRNSVFSGPPPPGGATPAGRIDPQRLAGGGLRMAARRLVRRAQNRAGHAPRRGH
jgi:ATP-dependent helicase/nuclease subunit B